MRISCSIIIPSHNCLPYLPASLGTITLQGREDLEVVVVDDASTDGTAAWLASVPHPGYRLNVIRTDGIGPSAARVRGIEQAQGDLIAFLDADDLWWPGKLDKQLGFHRHNPEAGLSFSDYIHMTPDGRTLGTCFEYWRCAWMAEKSGDYSILDQAEARLLETNIVGTSSVVATRWALDRAGGFDPSFKSAGDWDLWLRLAAVSEVGVSAAVTMSYLMRPGSVSTHRGRRIDATRRIIERYAERPEREYRRAHRIARARLGVIEAEAARLDARALVAAAYHLRALPAIPSLKLGRDIASDLAVLVTQLFARRAVSEQ